MLAELSDNSGGISCHVNYLITRLQGKTVKIKTIWKPNGCMRFPERQFAGLFEQDYLIF